MDIEHFGKKKQRNNKNFQRRTEDFTVANEKAHQ